MGFLLLMVPIRSHDMNYQHNATRAEAQLLSNVEIREFNSRIGNERGISSVLAPNGILRGPVHESQLLLLGVPGICATL